MAMKRSREFIVSVKARDLDEEEGPLMVYEAKRVLKPPISSGDLEENGRMLIMEARFVAETLMVELEKVDGGNRMQRATNFQGHPLKRDPDPDSEPGT